MSTIYFIASELPTEKELAEIKKLESESVVEVRNVRYISLDNKVELADNYAGSIPTGYMEKVKDAKSKEVQEEKEVKDTKTKLPCKPKSNWKPNN